MFMFSDFPSRGMQQGRKGHGCVTVARLKFGRGKELRHLGHEI